MLCWRMCVCIRRYAMPWQTKGEIKAQLLADTM